VPPEGGTPNYATLGVPRSRGLWLPGQRSA